MRLLDEAAVTAAKAAGPAVVDVATRLAQVEAENRETTRRLHQLTAERNDREDELNHTQAQMLAYAHDLRLAFQAERERNNMLEQAYVETVRTLSSAIEIRDPYTGGHVERVAQYGRILAEELGWSSARIRDLEVGALLHDTGKLGVPDAILRKPGPLDEDEWIEMRRHPATGASLVSGAAGLQSALSAVLYHHERYDGKGYPVGLSGEAIPLEARIVSVVDAFDAMLTTRPYRDALTLSATIQEIESNTGTQFDPQCAEAFLHVIRKGRLPAQ